MNAEDKCALLALSFVKEANDKSVVITQSDLIEKLEGKTSFKMYSHMPYGLLNGNYLDYDDKERLEKDGIKRHYSLILSESGRTWLNELNEQLRLEKNAKRREELQLKQLEFYNSTKWLPLLLSVIAIIISLIKLKS